MAESATILIPDISGYTEFQRLAERKTYVRFHAKWLSDPGPPREMTSAVLADYRQGLETLKMLCEKP
jgi:hypothetical protein